jgi:hypothetical protein
VTTVDAGVETEPAAVKAPQSPSWLPAARIASVVSCAALVAGVTCLVFLARAGGDLHAANWPVGWDLRSSDNTVLFQFAQDVFSHRPLDWSFSPQVYVFPEIPISLIAYGLASGSLAGYLLVVAAINNALMFLALFAVISRLFPRERIGRHLCRAALATVPLVLLPLLRGNWLLEYHLAPTYYFGMYLAMVAAPLLFLARSRGVRAAVGAGLALTAASNPLTLVFIVPASAVAGVVAWRANGWATVRRPITQVGVLLAVAAAVRLVLLRPLQATSPLSYIGAAAFVDRVRNIRAYLHNIWLDPVNRWPLALGGTLCFLGIAAAAVMAHVYVARRPRDGRALVAIYAGLLPATGLAATAALLITNYLYLWPVVIAPLVFVLVPVPRRLVTPLLATGVAGLALTAVLTHAAESMRHLDQYFAYRPPVTACLDDRLPPGVTVGYATFSDARRLELLSRRPFQLLPIKASGIPAPWLANLAPIRTTAGRFFYIDDVGDEPPISRSYLTTTFGTPDRTFACSRHDAVWLYDDPAKLAAIAARYVTRASS